MVKVNGKMENIAGLKLLEYLEKVGYDTKRLAVECNGEIVPKSEYSTWILKENDVLEVVSFVGGG